MTFNEWAIRNPQAAAELSQVTAQQPTIASAYAGHDESYAQQQARFAISRAGGLSWRNNVGATPAKVDYNCGRCGFHGQVDQRMVRYGLANDSSQLNAIIKSSDLIGVMPRTITHSMLGTTIGQFVAVECKRPGWHYTGKGREEAQQAYLAVVSGKGGLAQFSTGEVSL
jgi:hypothetical protein